MRGIKAFTAAAIFLFLSVLSAYPKEFDETKSLPESKYPDYSTMYLGEDKYEGINRKIFIFNSKMNKYLLRPANILWASIMPKYGMDRINGVYTNIQYPKRLVSSLIQRDFKASKDETLRFLANTTIGLGGMFDPAKSCFGINPADEDLEQAFCKCKIKSGPYLVIPGINGCTPRDITSKVLECPLDASFYIASPVTAIAKAGFLLNKTTYMQPFSKMIETNFADPYDITKKLYGIEKHLKANNYDRKEILTPSENKTEEITHPQMTIQAENTQEDDKYFLGVKPDTNDVLMKADVELNDYNPQNPLTDAMRTMLFSAEDADKSIWSELSCWNRSFDKKVKNASISLFEGREKYEYRYILQKDKKAPAAILYPSFAESSNAHHNLIFAKLLYDEGYSVIFLGNPFHWKFARSMPEGYYPGFPREDAKFLHLATTSIIKDIESKYGYNFKEKIIIGTSMGALDALFVGDLERENPTLGISKIIAVSPPIELVFALRQIDKFSDDWSKNIESTKHQASASASKILQLQEGNTLANTETLPFSEEEAKLLTCFYMRQKLSDLMFSLENIPASKKTDFYQNFNNTNFKNYSEKYMFQDKYTSLEDMNFDTSLYSIAEYLANSDNYKIYHSLDDYYVNKNQLQKLKEISGNKAIYLNNGSHLGFLYRKEFIEMLKNDVALLGNISLINVEK